MIDAFIKSETGRHGDAFKGQGRPDLVTGDIARDALNESFREVVN